MFTLAHLSDVHLAPMPRPRLRQLLNKRVLGYANWLRGRHEVHRRQTLDALTADLKRQVPDHIAVTGDLVNIGLPVEFAAALDWLEALGRPQDVTVVPGNHDAYVKVKHETGVGLWRDFMAGDAHGVPAHRRGPGGFPFVRIRGPLALVGLSTAVPTLPFMAAGRLDKVQLDTLPGLLRSLRDRELYRVLLIHHPPMHALAARHRGLQDAEKLLAILRLEGVELVLYGHNHDQSVDRIETATGPAPAVGVPSASASRAGHKSLARYNLFRIARSASGWQCTMTGRGLAEPEGEIVEIEQVLLTA
jgi:3',5'-cyclic AMP phosphodiesterase CpdA